MPDYPVDPNTGMSVYSLPTYTSGPSSTPRAPAAARARTPFYTPEQWKDLLKLSDLSETEASIARQRAAAKELRGAGENGRMDWASQAGRGLSGVAAGIQDYRAAKAQKQYELDKARWLDKAMSMGGDAPATSADLQPEYQIAE